MIWHFALCVVPTSVLLQGDCIILRDTQRPVYTRKQLLLLTKNPQLHQFMPTKSVDDQVTMDETLFSNFVAEHNSCNQTVKLLIEGSTINLYTMNVSLYTILHHCFIIIQLFNYKVQICAFKADAQNLPLRRVGRGEISPLAVPRG